MSNLLLDGLNYFCAFAICVSLDFFFFPSWSLCPFFMAVSVRNSSFASPISYFTPFFCFYISFLDILFVSFDHFLLM